MKHLFYLLALLTSQVAIAQSKGNIKGTIVNEKNDTANHTLQEVIVSSSRIPGSTASLTRTNTPLRDIPQQVQIIDRSVLNEQQSFYANDVFRYAAGITSTDYYGGFSSRGYTTAASSVTTNGMKGSPYPEGQTALLGNIESVEVIHGPAAILNGTGGMGGNINLVTKPPKKLTTLNASVAAGSFNLYRAQADVTGSINPKKTLYFLAGAGFQDGGSFIQQFDRRSIQLYGALKWDISSRTSWLINGNYVNDDASNNYQPRIPIYNTRNRDSMFRTPYDFNPGADSRYRGNNTQLQSVIEHRFSDDWKLSFLAAFNQSKAERAQYYASGYVNATTNVVGRYYSWQNINSPQTTLNLYLTGKLQTGPIKHQFIVGGDAMLSKNNYPRGILQYAATSVNVFDPVKDETYDTTGMVKYYDTQLEKFSYAVLGTYVQDQIELLSNLKLLAGLRYNNYDRRHLAINRDGTILNDEKPLRTENFSPRVGLVYQPVKSLSIYADYNEGFEPQYGNYAENGGPFDPLTSKEMELGAKGEFLKGLFQPFISIYQSTKKNVLQSAPRTGFPYWQEPIGEVRSRGVELGAKAIFLKSLLVIVNYNYNKTKITESKRPDEIGQLFANNPQNSANGWVRYGFNKGTLKGLFIGSGFQFVDSRYFSNKKAAATNILAMPAYTLIDASLGYRYKQYTLQVNGNNLADKRYAQNGSVNAYSPGMPRNFLVTFSYSLK